MFPGTSPVFFSYAISPPGETNVPQPGNDRRVNFADYAGQGIDEPQVEEQFTEQGNPWLETWRITSVTGNI